MKRILIVDDAATVRMYHRGILESAGYTVEEAWNGIEALEKTLESSFDLYVVDVNMPKLDGYGFLRELRQQEIPQQPAIMVSTEAAPRDESAAYQAGANGYLIKPVRPAQLLAHVRSHAWGGNPMNPPRQPLTGAVPLRGPRPAGKHRQKADATGRVTQRSGAFSNELFRCVHTLKGNSGLFTFPEMTRVLHAGEDLLGMVRSGRDSLFPGVGGPPARRDGFCRCALPNEIESTECIDALCSAADVGAR